MRIQQATAELSEMASGMISEIGGAGDTLNRLEEMIDEERNKAAGRARVARGGLDLGDVEMAEAEREALADAALADFAAAEGIAMAADEAAALDAFEHEEEEGGKSMGPVAEGA
jgi:phage shock protein A